MAERTEPIFGDPRLPSRFWAKAHVTADGCWQWHASLTGKGYGQYSSKPDANLAHRAAYQALVEQVPSGKQLDHLCRNRACCNPAHLEPVTRRENILRGTAPCADRARQTQCKWGHRFTPENTRLDKRGQRHCRLCGLVDNWIRRGVASLHQDEIDAIRNGGPYTKRSPGQWNGWTPSTCEHCGHVGRFRHDRHTCSCGMEFCIQIGRPRRDCQRCWNKKRRAEPIS